MVAEKTRGSAPANTPGQMKLEKVENVLRDPSRGPWGPVNFSGP